MKNLMICLICLLLFNTVGCSQDSPKTTNLLEKQVYSIVHKYNNWFHSGDMDSLAAMFLDSNYTIDNLSVFRDKVNRQLGNEDKVLNERVFYNNTSVYYQRFSSFDKTDRPVQTVIGCNNKNKIYTFSIESLPAEAKTRFMNYKTIVKLKLPFIGEWYVSSGGRSINYNQHVVSQDQRFAYDFNININRISFVNDGSQNEDYFCFAREILAPGPGVIVETVNDVKENKPGELGSSPGNYIVIDHGNSEYSFLAHFKQGSVAVKPGERVKTGQLLGLCGNSGHSSEAHLHYHLQNSPNWFDGEGLPAQFHSYTADGEDVKVGEPLWDQLVINRE